MNKKFLPLGTVVLLKGGEKRIMITGFCCITKENPTLYDYMGCLYPEGFVASDKNILFNHDQIDKIYFMGYSDEENQKFMEALNDYVAKLDK